MNQVVFVGNLTSDPELVYGENGLARCRISIALDRPPARDGAEEKAPEYRNITIFGVQGENAAESFVKGTRIFALARTETYQTVAMVDVDGEWVERKFTTTGYVAQHIGPELRFATAQVTKNPKKGHSQGNDRPVPPSRQDQEPQQGPSRRPPRRPGPASEPAAEPEQQPAPTRRAPSRPPAGQSAGSDDF